LQDSTESISWCNQTWWSKDKIAEDDLLSSNSSLKIWKEIDSWYRSRVLELPGLGECMVPGIDMANHAPAETATARYELDDEGNVVLQLQNAQISEGNEISIKWAIYKNL
jgi:hypothetical protein